MEVFKGHKDTILDIVSSSTLSQQIVATSSEDKTIRLWDPRGKGAVKCYVGFESPVTSLSFHPRQEHSLLGLTDSSLLEFDLRHSGVICREFHPLYRNESETELECFTYHPREEMVAIGDDDGIISLLNLQTKRITKRLSRVHLNLLGQIMFCQSNPNILISGGFDSLCCAWDINRGRPSSNIINFTEKNQTNSSNLQIANPPFVHDLLSCCDHRFVLVALGDGTIQLLRSSDGSLSVSSLPLEAHAGMTTKLSSYSDSSFLSVGADGLIKLWDIKQITDENEIPNDETSTFSSQSRKKKNQSKKSSSSSKPKKLREWYGYDLRGAISHPNKINSIGSIEINSSESKSIIVCDISSDWYMYPPGSSTSCDHAIV